MKITKENLQIYLPFALAIGVGVYALYTRVAKQETPKLADYNTTKRKYKQTIIPKVYTQDCDSDPHKVKEYYTNNLQGLEVINQDLNIKIKFSSRGKSKLIFGGRRTPEKRAVLRQIVKILEVAEFNNFGQRKEKDGQDIIGYLNFKAKVLINDELKHLRIAIIFRKNGKFYYNHEINIIK